MEVNAFHIARHLSDLVGRPVQAKVVSEASFAPGARTAYYRVEPHAGTAVVQIDFPLLTALGGAMIGFPPAEIEQQTAIGKLDENLTDATREVLNVLSAVVVSEGRAIYQSLHATLADCSARVREVLGGGFYPLTLQVSLSGSKPGYLRVVSDTI